MNDSFEELPPLPSLVSSLVSIPRSALFLSYQCHLCCSIRTYGLLLGISQMKPPHPISPHLTERSIRLFADHFHRAIPQLSLDFSPACYSGDKEFALQMYRNVFNCTVMYSLLPVASQTSGDTLFNCLFLRFRCNQACTLPSVQYSSTSFPLL